MNGNIEEKEVADDDVPTWLPRLLEKVKKDICVEVGARISYNVRIMLDGVLEDLKASINAINTNQAHISDECICQEPKKSKGYKEKRAGVRPLHTSKKEERKQIKGFYKERRKAAKQLKSSSTEGETEFDIPVEWPVPDKLATVLPSGKGVNHKPPPVPPRVLPRSQKVPVLLSANGAIPKENLNLQRPESVLSSSNNRKNSQENVFLTSLTKKLPISTEEISFVPPQVETKMKEVSSMYQPSFPLPDQLSKSSSTDSSQAMSMKSSINPSLENSQLLMTDMFASPIPSPEQSFGFGISAAASEMLDIKNQGISYDPPSDSEFEVVSMPPQSNLQVKYECGAQVPLLSEFTDSEEESREGQAVAKVKPLITSAVVNDGTNPNGSLYPIAELQNMSAAFEAVNQSLDPRYSISKDLSSNSQDSVLVMERERAPYCVPPEGVEKINNEEVILGNRLPDEFNRDRTPYRATVKPEEIPARPCEPKDQQRNPLQQHMKPDHQGTVQRDRAPQPQSASQQQAPQSHSTSQQQQRPTPQTQSNRQQQNTGVPLSREREDGSDLYRVDLVPEGLWDGAMTIGAQAYNATKNMVEMISSSLNGDQTSSYSSSSSSSSSSQRRGEPTKPQQQQPQQPPTPPSPMQKLIDMGFTNHVLNSRLLARHKNDIDKVIEELLVLQDW